MDAAPDTCGARRTARRRIGWIVLGVVSFVVVAAVLGRLSGPQFAPTLRPKVNAFLADKDSYDAVYIGSSRVQRGVRPDVIDPRLSTPERPFRSFNLGVPGMESFEADAVLREILAAKPERLRFVLIEAPRWRVPTMMSKKRTVRDLQWHDVSMTREMLRSIWRTSDPLRKKLEWSWDHLRLFFWRLSNYARGSLLPSEPTPAVQRLTAGLATVRGYIPLSEQMGGRAAERRRRFLSNARSYRKEVAEIRRRAEDGILPDAAVDARYNRPALVGQVERLREAGVVPVYFAPPLLIPVADYEGMAREGWMPHLIDLRDPREYPSLFDPGQRFDREHMTLQGARRMSLEVARQLGPIVAADEANRPD